MAELITQHNLNPIIIYTMTFPPVEILGFSVLNHTSPFSDSVSEESEKSFHWKTLNFT